jgi:hypothetical protein
MVPLETQTRPPEFVERMNKEGRTQITRHSAPPPLLSPPPQRQPRPSPRRRRGNPATTPLDGLPPRLLRLPDSLSCYSPSATRTPSESEHPQEVQGLAPDVKPGGKRNTEFRKWRTCRHHPPRRRHPLHPAQSPRRPKTPPPSTLPRPRRATSPVLAHWLRAVRRRFLTPRTNRIPRRIRPPCPHATVLPGAPTHLPRHRRHRR